MGSAAEVIGQESRLREASSGTVARASCTLSSSGVLARCGQWSRWPCNRVPSVAAWWATSSIVFPASVAGACTRRSSSDMIADAVGAAQASHG